MRRGCSVILLVIGGWILSAITIVGMIPADEAVSPWVMVAVFACFSLPFLLVGAWMSPGRRLAELGLTLMIAAGVALLTFATVAAIWFDEAFMRLMPKSVPELDFTSPAAIVSLIVVGGSGYWLWRRSRVGS